MVTTPICEAGEAMARKKQPTNKQKDELSADDYAILGAALTTLGDFFALLALVKARNEEEDDGNGSG